MNDQASLAFTYAAEGCKNWAAALTQFAGVFSALAENAKHASPDASLTIAINNNAAPKAAKGSTKARKQSLPAPPKDPKATPVLKSKKSAAPANKTTLVPAKPVVPAVESITAEEEDGDADGDADMNDDDDDSDMDRPIRPAKKKAAAKKPAPAEKTTTKKQALPKFTGDGEEGNTSSGATTTVASRKQKKPAKKSTEAAKETDEEDSVSTRADDPEMNAGLTTPKKTKTHAPFSRTPNSTPKANGDIGDKDVDEDESASNLKKKPRGKSSSAANDSSTNAAKEKASRLLTSPKSRLKKQTKSDLSKKKNKKTIDDKENENDNEGNTVPESEHDSDSDDFDDMPLHRSTKKKKKATKANFGSPAKSMEAKKKAAPPPPPPVEEEEELEDVEVSESESYIVDESDDDTEDPELALKAIREVLEKHKEPKTKKYITENAKAAHGVPLVHLSKGMDQLLADKVIIKKNRGFVLQAPVEQSDDDDDDE